MIHSIDGHCKLSESPSVYLARVLPLLIAFHYLYEYKAQYSRSIFRDLHFQA